MEEQVNRHQQINTTTKKEMLYDLQKLLHENHALVRLFKTALEWYVNKLQLSENMRVALLNDSMLKISTNNC